MLFFKKKKAPDPEKLQQEKWNTHFGMFNTNRFNLEETGSYCSYIDKKQFFLELNQENLFAWVLDPQFQYSDFYLEAETGFSAGNPYSAMGYIFRYKNDENFYYFLISNRGYFRFDVVFNGNPMSLIPWTHSPLITGQENSIHIIANDSRFSFFVDDEWIAEIEDDTFAEGKIAFAAQNFNDGSRAAFYMNRFLIDSRPEEVEKQHERWNEYIPVDPESRITLAKSLFTHGLFSPAAVQMKKALKKKKPVIDDMMFFAEILINLRIYDVALEYIEKCLALEPERKEAILEKANLLYIQNKFIPARDFILNHIEAQKENAPLWNLLGNSEYSIGNWEKAITAYMNASQLQPDNPLFLVNAARAQEMNKENEKALDNYLKASKTLFQQESYGDLYNILPRVTKLDPENKSVQAFQAKMLFHENKTEEAEELIFQLIDSGYAESSIFYLAGVLLSDEENRKEAISFLEEACRLEPDFYLNWYKLAENLFFAGKDPSEALNMALDLNPNHPWTQNLAGLIKQKEGDINSAVKFFNGAYQLEKNDLNILLNLSDALHMAGKKEEAFGVLENEAFADDHRLINHKGNLCARDKDFNQAIKYYDRALRMDENNPIYMENMASVCIELDMILKAEELLLKLYETNPSASVMALTGTLALVKNEFKRAEVAYAEALNMEPTNIHYRLNLISVFIHKQDYNTAKQLTREFLLDNPDSEEGRVMVQRIRKQFEERHLCDKCTKEWWVPLSLPIQEKFRITGEPPGSAPAGKCPVCEKVFCIECAREYLKEDRLTCPECGEFLKLSEDWIKYALLEEIEEQKATNVIKN